jgi:hypothetical protein
MTLLGRTSSWHGSPQAAHQSPGGIAGTALPVIRARRFTAAIVAATMLALAGGAGSAGAAATDTSVCSKEKRADDKRLGPAQLPTTGPLAEILDGYNALGKPPFGINAFFAKFWHEASKTEPREGWNYPAAPGFLIRGETQVEEVETLQRGLQVDRFGKENGRFLSVKGTPYGNRSLPPDNLNPPEKEAPPPAFRAPCNYHVYRVRKRFKAHIGPAAPGFGQPGLFTQFMVDDKSVKNFKPVQKPGDERPSRLDVSYLVQKQYLVPQEVLPAGAARRARATR